MSMFLSDDELVTLTGYRQASKQVAHLKGQRIPFHMTRAGKPVVVRNAYSDATALICKDRMVSESIRASLKAHKAAKRAKVKEKLDKIKATAAALPALKRYHCAKRRAVTLQRSPQWADAGAIRAIYAQAKALTASTGVEYHVDHIIPLTGKLVSGLHVHQNLQIITAVQNLIKHNRFEIQ